MLINALRTLSKRRSRKVNSRPNVIIVTPATMISVTMEVVAIARRPVVASASSNATTNCQPLLPPTGLPKSNLSLSCSVRAMGVEARDSWSSIAGVSCALIADTGSSVPSFVVRKPKLASVGAMPLTISMTSVMAISAPTTAASSPF